jgi:transcriptional regulator with XRE-family HTH domain
MPVPITELIFPKSTVVWTRDLIRQLRGKRTQTEFGKLLGVPKNTVWRWEAGRTVPGTEHSQRLSQLASSERFFTGWRLEGSGRILGDLEQASKEISSELIKSINRSARQLIK